MKGILVVIDGMGDLPHKLLDNKTPLEAAKTPNMDFLATRGEMGFMYTVKPGFTPSSDEAIVSLFANPLSANSRGQFAARGAGLRLKKGDLAMRTNFATVDERGNVVDRRAGRNITEDEAEELSEAINDIEIPVEFYFKPTIQHRGVLVFSGNFSDKITPNDSKYLHDKKEDEGQILDIQPLNKKDEVAIYTSEILNGFLAKVKNVLQNHPVNVRRRKKGLMPANYLLLRGAGTETPKLKQYKKWMAVHSMPLEIGFSDLSGMYVFKSEVPNLRGIDVYSHLHKTLKKNCKNSIKAIKRNWKRFDYVYIHIKETDLPGHDNKPFEKKEMLETVDKILIKFLRKFCPPHEIKVVITADHSTPCKLKGHSADPVPVLFYNNSLLKEKHFSEKEARLGSLGRILGPNLLKKVMFDR